MYFSARCWRRRFAVAIAALVAVACFLSPAPAIVNGKVDSNNTFPNVGAIVVVKPVQFPSLPALANPPASVACGILIHPRVMLAAGHVTAPMEQLLAEGTATLDDFRVSFSPNSFDRKSWHEIADVITHPNYDRETLDIGVIILKKPVKGVTPAELPPAFFLDDLSALGLLPPGSPFAIAGYGQTSHNWNPPDGKRRFGVNVSVALFNDVLTLSAGDAPGHSHAWNQDSGSAAFWINPDSGDLVLAGVFSINTPQNYTRVDRPVTQDFLADVIAAVVAGQF